MALSINHLNLLPAPGLPVRGPLRPRRLLLLLEGDQGEVGAAQGQVHRGERGAGAEGPAGRTDMKDNLCQNMKMSVGSKIPIDNMSGNLKGE